MSNLIEGDNWEDDIYQISRGDKVEGGANGISNRQARQLSARTQFLKKSIESLQEGREYTIYVTPDDPDGTLTGLASTTDGQLFRVGLGAGEGAVTYVNDSGVAVEIFRTAGENELKSITTTVRVNDNENVVTSYADQDGRVGAMIIRNENGDVEVITKKINLSPNKIENESVSLLEEETGFVFCRRDIDGRVVLALTDEGRLLTKGNGTTESASSRIHQYNLENLQKIMADQGMRVRIIEQPNKKLSVMILYGQSNTVGADAFYALSNENMFGNMMLGQSPRGSHFSSGITDYTYGPVGGENKLYPLVEVDNQTGPWGETPVSGLVNMLKWQHNRARGVANDDEHIFAGVSCGVSGKSIGELSPGNAREYYNRYRTALTGFKEAADALGYTISACGILYLGCEADAARDYDYVKSSLDNLIKNMIADARATFTAGEKIHVVVGQFGGMFAYDETHDAAARALVDYCDENEDVSFLMPYHNLPGFAAHGFSNTNRWMGCQAAKLFQRAFNGMGNLVPKIAKATHHGNSVLISIPVPVPPLRYVTAFDKSTPVRHTDWGFTFTDSLGAMYGDAVTVEVAADTVLKVTLPREPVGELRVSLGDQKYHQGIHNVADSDASISPFLWEFVPDSKMPPEENIADLVGKNYPLYNMPARYSVISTPEDE